MRLQRVLARLAFGGFAVALAIALAASWGTRLGWWDVGFGLTMLNPCGAAGLVGFVAGLIWLVRSLARNTSDGWRYGAVGFTGAAIIAGVLLNAAIQTFVAPPIHDISTDIEHAPAFQALLPLRQGAPNKADYDGPDMVVYQGKRMSTALAQKKAYPDIKPYAGLFDMHDRPNSTPMQVLFWRGFETAKQMGWNVVAFDPAQGRVEAMDTSFWFGLTDDIVIRVRPAGRLGARLDIRSKSRVGVSDRGKNAARIRDYFKAL